MNETAPCADCNKPTDATQTCETCGKVVCPECERNDENLLHSWCGTCAPAQADEDAPKLQMSNDLIPEQAEMLYQIQGCAEVGEGFYHDAVTDGLILALVAQRDKALVTTHQALAKAEALKELEVGLEIASRDAPDVQLLPAMLKFLRAAVAGKSGATPGPVQQIVQAAAQLYDNRLGWSDGRNPYAPPELWDDLGRALGRDAAGFCEASPAPAASVETQPDEWAYIPPEMVQLVNLLGPVAWGQTEPQSAAEHAEWVAKSVQVTAETFGQGEEPQPMSMLFTEPEGDDQVVIGYIGTSPNSPIIARALCGAWNRLAQECAALASAPEERP